MFRQLNGISAGLLGSRTNRLLCEVRASLFYQGLEKEEETWLHSPCGWQLQCFGHGSHSDVCLIINTWSWKHPSTVCFIFRDWDGKFKIQILVNSRESVAIKVFQITVF